jgi:hypothetical protein
MDVEKKFNWQKNDPIASTTMRTDSQIVQNNKQSREAQNHHRQYHHGNKNGESKG